MLRKAKKGGSLAIHPLVSLAYLRTLLDLRVAGALSHVPSRGGRLSTHVLVPFQRIPALLSTLRAENVC